jgi:uncharacterized RDD family membrane protein YckC
MENRSQGAPRSSESASNAGLGARRVQAAAFAVALWGIIAIAPIGKTGFNLPGAISGLVLLAVALLIYWRFFIALVLATALAAGTVAGVALLMGPADGLLFLPFLIACAQALSPMWERRRERRKPGAPQPGPGAISITYAPVGRRALAGLIDAVAFIVLWWLAAILLTIAFAVAGAFDVTNPTPAMYDALTAPFFALGLVLNVLYFVGFWSLVGRTPGMMVTGLRVVTEDQRKISLPAALLRYIAVLPSALLVVGLLWPIWDSRKQGWHDKAAHSFVVRVQLVLSSLQDRAIASSPAV